MNNAKGDVVDEVVVIETENSHNNYKKWTINYYDLLTTQIV